VVVGCFVDFIDLDQSLGVPSGFNLLSNLVPGPVKLWPGRWSSNGRLLTALLNKPLPDFTNCVYVFPQTAQVTFNITRPFFCDEMMQVICLCVSLTFNAIRHFLIWMIKMDIKDLTWNEISSRRFNNPLFPKSIRGILVGKSACGKTTLQLNFLLRPGWLDYNNLNIYGKCLF